MIIYIVEQDDVPTTFAEQGYWTQIPEGSSAGPGWFYRNGELQEPAPYVPNLGKKLTKFAFLSRFTDEEAISIDLASIGATVEAATIRRYLAKISAAEFIDLESPDLQKGLTTLEAVGLLGEGRSNDILTAPVQEHEVP